MKKALLIVGAIIGGLFVLWFVAMVIIGTKTGFKTNESKEQKIEGPGVVTADTVDTREVDPKEVAQKNVAWLKTFKPQLTDATSIVTDLLSLDACIVPLKNPETTKKMGNAVEKELRMATVNWQKKNLPVMRKHWVNEILYPLAWKEDINVSIKGSTLYVTGHIFAANRNIDEFQTTIAETLRLLRFKQVQYRWYKQSDEYQYYDLKTPKDEELEPFVIKSK